MNYTIEQALNSVFWYEGLLRKDAANDTYAKNSIILKIIDGLRQAAALGTGSFYTFEMLPEDFDWQHRHTVIWQILVEMFGNYGTSPRTGWIDNPGECADFLEKIISTDSC